MCTDCYENVINACSFKKVIADSDKKVRTSLEDSLKIEYLGSEMPEDIIYDENDEYENENCEVPDLEEDSLDESMEDSPKLNKSKLEVQKCYLCDIDFPNKIQKLSHFREEHSAEERINCNLCSHVAKNAVFLNIHLKNHNSSFGCTKCFRKFATKEILDLHKSTENCSKKRNSKIQICTDCGQQFNRTKDYADHMKQKADVFDCSTLQPIPVKCYLCDETFKFNYMKKAHLEEAHTMAEYNCNHCDIITKTAKSLDRHLRTHFEDIPEVICEKCGRKFLYVDLLKKHILQHHQQRSVYSCDICGVEVTMKQSILRHMKTVHLKMFTFQCEECGPGYSYANRTSYNAHLFRTHGKTPNISCPDCNMGFTFSYELKNHKGKDGNCGKTKEYVRMLDKDNKIKWKGPKTWEYAYFSDKKREIFCKICDKRYTTTDNLMIHYKVQHQGYRFQCDLCSSSYSSRKGLRTHKITKHMNLRPYECDVCKKNFNEKRNLDRHL